MIPAMLLVGSLAALDPLELRKELDARPWTPEPAAPVASVPPVASPPAPPVSQAPAAAPAAPTAPSVPRSGDVSSGTWRVQLAALSEGAPVQRERQRFERLLGPGTVVEVRDGALVKLRWGSFPSREAAEAARATLKEKGVDGFCVLERPRP